VLGYLNCRVLKNDERHNAQVPLRAVRQPTP
jgi:hypothetical protein